MYRHIHTYVRENSLLKFFSICTFQFMAICAFDNWMNMLPNIGKFKDFLKEPSYHVLEYNDDNSRKDRAA